MCFGDKDSLPGDADTLVQVDAAALELDPCGADRRGIDVHFSDNVPYLLPDTLFDQCGEGCIVLLCIGYNVLTEGWGDTEVLPYLRS